MGILSPPVHLGHQAFPNPVRLFSHPPLCYQVTTLMLKLLDIFQVRPLMKTAVTYLTLIALFLASNWVINRQQNYTRLLQSPVAIQSSALASLPTTDAPKSRPTQRQPNRSSRKVRKIARRNTLIANVGELVQND